MKGVFTTLFIVCSFICATAQDADKVKDLEQRVRSLEERIAMAEARIARSEQRASNASRQTPAAEKMQQAARQHMMDDRKNHSAEDIRRAEELYSEASRRMHEGGSYRQLLDSVVSLYPQVNRAGCAQLYRAQQETGQEKERLLKDCIARFCGCYYGDGAQVGPLAMFELAAYYERTGKDQDAKELFNKIRKEYAEAIGHDGVLLVDEM